MKRRRKSRFLARRSRKENIPARSRVSLADRSKRRRPPTNPFAALKIRFFALFLAAPFLERIVGYSSHTRGVRLIAPGRYVKLRGSSPGDRYPRSRIRTWRGKFAPT